ncbi:MAG: indole-3-glycerol phosphate synthase TrpC, partial [Veillonella sp.]|nr:indole-3-glycerol phosphate synthase TrpC [Veillonella sp.]
MILDKIVAATRQRVAQEKEALSLEDLKVQVEALPVSQDFPFEKALKAQDFNFICEVKKASPSKGIIAEDFPYLDIAKDYERAGAACISVLTEPDFFKGSPQYLQEIVAAVSIPVIRKDFIIDPYQIYQAKLWGASAVLLIVACLTDQELKDFQDLAHSLGLSALVEAHDEEEVQRALAIGARIVGVNNRNLKDFTVDIQNSIRLRHLAPKDVIFVSESGLNTAQDIQTLRDNDIHAALMGESFMRAPDKAAKLAELYGPLRDSNKRNNSVSNEGKLDGLGQGFTTKFCGITSPDVIPALVEAGPDYVGFVFAPSKRQVTQYQAQELIRVLRTCEVEALAAETQEALDQDLSADGPGASRPVDNSGTDANAEI